MALGANSTTPTLDNVNVDDIIDQQGVIDTFNALSFDMDDRDIIKGLNQQIQDSEDYWNDPKNFDLKQVRSENARMHLGKVEETGLYKHQRPYKENQIFISEESIVSYVTSQIAGPVVLTGSTEPADKLFASNFEKAMKTYFSGGVTEDVNLENLNELWTRDILNKRIAIGHFYYNKDIDEIILEHVDPEHVILDKNTAKGANPRFICHAVKRTVEELLNDFPDKEEDILSHLGIQRKTPKQMTRELSVRKVWVTHYDEAGQAQEGLVWYFDNVVLEKVRNPNYLYAKKQQNVFKYPKKPYIFGNLVNYGTHMIDSTTPLEQAIELQKNLMRRGRQISESADKANGVLVVSTKSGLTKEDVQNLTGAVSQKLVIDDENNLGVEKLVTLLQAQELPNYVIADKMDIRTQIGNVMGAPSDFTGSQADDGDPTLGEVMIKKNQAAGRQDMMVRAMTRMNQQAFQYFAQMAMVWYTDERTFVYDAGDGDVDVITLKRNVIPKGLVIKASKPANPDRSRIEAITLKLLNEKAISLLDAYKMLQLDNAQQLYDNWAKQTADPTTLARDALDVIDEADAYVVFDDIMAGKTPDEKENPTKEYVLSLRKLMINDKFLKAKKSDQNRFIKYVNQCLDSLEQRMALEEASDMGPTGEGLRPGAQLPNPNQPPQQGAPMGQPGTMPQGMGMPPPAGLPPMAPGGTPPPMGMPGAAGLPPQGMPLPAPTPNSVFGGTPLPAPGQAPQPNPGDPSSLGML